MFAKNASLAVLMCILVVISRQQQVQLAQGTVRGVEIPNLQANFPVFAYRGIPYAEPPVGNKRFKPSQRHSGWQGTFPALSFGPPCPQPSGSMLVKSSMSEDCLFVNVWTTKRPGDDGDSNRRPVVIFFEGQLFTLSNPSDVPGEDLVASSASGTSESSGQSSIVFVSASYRTNAFGFLSLQDQVIEGNLGLGDQALAIEWTYENIARFGGNPDRISVMGHSAGAASSLLHLIDHQRSSRFIKGAVLLSGSALAPWSVQPRPKDNAMVLARNLGCSSRPDNSEEVLRCLQSRSMESIVDAVDEMISGGNVSAIFAPVINNSNIDNNNNSFVLENSPEDYIRRGRIKEVPILVSSVVDEGLLMAYFLKDVMDQVFTQQFSSFLNKTVLPFLVIQVNSTLPPSLITTLLEHNYFSQLTPSTTRDEMFRLISDFYNEAYFSAPIERQLRLLSSHNDEVFYAVNTFETAEPQDIFGNGIPQTRSSHGIDLLYLFGPAMYRKFLPGRLESLADPRAQFPSFAEERLSRNLKAIFSEFISTGRPIRSFSWPSYDPDERSFYDVFQGRSGENFQPQGYKFWYQLIPNLEEALLSSRASNDGTTTGQTTTPGQNGNDDWLMCSTYTAYTWLLLSAVIILILALIALILFIVLWKRRGRDGDSHKGDHSYDGQQQDVFSVSNSVVHRKRREDLLDHPEFAATPSNDRRRKPSNWRDSVMDYQL